MRLPRAFRGFAALVAATAMAMAPVVPVKARSEVLVAVVATEDSPHQPNGEAVAEAAAAAVARLQADGGLLGQPVRVRIWREDCSRARAAEIAAEVARARPALVIGHLCQPAAAAAAAVYAASGLLFITSTRATTPLPAAGRLVFRLAGRDDRLAGDLASYIARRHPGQGVAVIGDRTQQGRRLAGAIEQALVNDRIAVALSERIESSEKSYADVARRIRASGAGVVVMPAQPRELAIIAATLRRDGPPLPIVGSDVLAVPDVASLARQEGERLVLMLPWTGLEATRTALDPAMDLMQIGVATASAIHARTTAAIEAWTAAARRAASFEPSAVGAQLVAGGATTVAGEIRFDAGGDGSLPSYVPYTWSGGGWRRVVP